MRSWVVSPGTAISATMDLTQRDSLSPGLCRSLVKESYSSSPVRVLLSCWGTREYNQETAICEVTGTIKPETEEQIGRESSGIT